MKLKPEIIEQIEVCLACSIADLKGKTLRKIFRDCEKMGATVYWGFWTKEKLDSII